MIIIFSQKDKKKHINSICDYASLYYLLLFVMQNVPLKKTMCSPFWRRTWLHTQMVTKGNQTMISGRWQCDNNNTDDSSLSMLLLVKQ